MEMPYACTQNECVIYVNEEFKFVLWLHCKIRHIQLFRERDKKGGRGRIASNSLSSRERERAIMRGVVCMLVTF